MYDEEKKTLGTRIRRIRIQQGLTQKVVAQSAAVSVTTIQGWERGFHAPVPWNLPLIASALGVPVAQLFTDTSVLAEIRVSEDTLGRVRAEGRGECELVAGRIASQLEPLVWEAATRQNVDVRPGARAAKKRMTRAERLRGLKAADRAQRAARKRAIS